MNAALSSILLVLAIFGSNCHQAPATTRLHYEVGSVYTYDYIVGLELNEPSSPANTGNVSTIPKPPSTVGYKVLTQVQVRPVWQNEPAGTILEITLVNPRLQIKSRRAPQPDGFRDHLSQLESTKHHPLYVHWKNGAIQKTFSITTDDTSLVNIKKGIANLLQIPSTINNGEIVEQTPMGQCKIQYDNRESHRVTRKFQGNCEQLAAAQKFPFSSHNSRVLGAQIESEVSSTTTLTQQEAVIVEEAQVTESHVVRTTAKQEVGAYINASQSLKLQGSSSTDEKIIMASSAESAIKEIAKTSGLQLTTDTLVSQPEKIPQCEANTCKNIDTLVKSLTLENVATTKMASAFIQLVAKFREATTDEIEKVLQKNKKVILQLLDACAASGSLAAHKAAMKVLDFDDDEFYAQPERYLIGLSLAPSVPVEVVPDLFNLVKKKVKSPKLEETAILTVAALVNILRMNSQRTSTGSTPVEKLIGADVEEYLVASLENCTLPACEQVYLRSLKNLKSPATLDKLFEIVQKDGDPKTSVTAIKAIQAFPDSAISLKYRPILVKVVNQLVRKYDSSSRTIALDILLRNNPTRDEIKEILHLLKKQDSQHAEVTTYMWNRLQEFMETNRELDTYVANIITEEGMKTYHHLSPKGLSTAFSRVFTRSSSGNSSFSNAIEMSGKILKRSSFDVYIKSQDDQLHLLSLGIFAGGLSSFTSSDDTAAQDDTEDATAGMELTLMGIQMRPIVFFTGKGELMSLVWSGTGSERTSALQGNVMLQDEKRVIPLYCGLVADVNIQGGLAFDLAGQIQLSLWHRTANSLVENKAGLLLQSLIRVDTSFVRSRIDYTVAAESALHFTSDINFYDGVLMCLKLTQPEFIVKQNIHKTERIPGSKHKLRKAKYKTTPIQGITYALNKKNSELCGVMYKDEL